MTVVYDRHGVTVHHAEALAVLRDMPDASVDAVVCDPPYNLSFMGREWDRLPDFQAWCTEWARECLRVMKPGAHLAAFGGTRTYHRLACGIEDAGFEIRDGLQWLHGQGFPKGVDIGKAIDKAAPRQDMFGAFAAHYGERRQALGLTHREICERGGFYGEQNKGGASVNWEKGYGVPTAAQWPTVAAILDMPIDMWSPLIERAEAEREVVGSTWGSRRPGFSGSTYGEVVNGDYDVTAPATDAARQWQGWNTSLRPSFEPIILARKPLAGTVAQTVLAHGTGALNIDACRTGTGGQLRWSSPRDMGYHGGTDTQGAVATTNDQGRWPANVLLSHAPLLDERGQPVGDACADGCIEGCPVAELDGQSGTLSSWMARTNYTVAPSNEVYGKYSAQPVGPQNQYGDTGGASRFMPTFRWEAKAPTSERPQVNGVSHPTTKPLGLIRWLVRLLTPPGGLVVDPFAGSGTTGHAARAEGMRAVLVEREADYIPLIKARLDARERTPAAATGTTAGDEPLDLLDLLDQGGAA